MDDTLLNMCAWLVHYYNAGFGEHPHREVEICTYVVSGKLTHQDSMGTEETLGRGAIQFMVSLFGS